MARRFGATFLKGVWRIVKGLPLALISPILLIAAAISLFLCDVVCGVVFRVRPRRALPSAAKPDTRAATIVIPNWNGRDLLKKYLPLLIAAVERCPGSEVMVVDNGSTDGSAQFILENHPQVRVIALPENRGFGGGSNEGFRHARHDIVVLLNSDMRVERDFLRPLLDAFRDENTFAVSCQIFFTDPNKLREETGLTEGWWQQGALRVRHRTEESIRDPYPCFYGGGGSCAFDRRKFLELGGFDPILAPFYLEDTDIGFLAWKRGWNVLYQPSSVVYHEHRGTIGRHFSEVYIQSVLKKNFLLFAWKNIHEWPRLWSHFFFTWTGAILSWLTGDSPERTNLAGLARATWQLPGAIASRARARSLAVVSDTEAFRRPLGGHFRDTFTWSSDVSTRPQAEPPGPLGRPQAEPPAPLGRIGVLFVSPYPICPPVHGGAVFMYQTVKAMARLCDLHLIVLLDHAHEREPHAELERICGSVEYFLRMQGKQKAIGSIVPFAVREFRNADLAWMIQRKIYQNRIDVLQLEYTVMGQYAGGFRHIPSIVFEHDVYFQSVARRMPFIKGVFPRIRARWEYLRALRYELRMLPKADRVQVCSVDNAQYLASFLPSLRGRIDAGFRAGIDTSLYKFHAETREPFTMLFLGSFRHLPNHEALHWFVDRVLPKVRAKEPRARLIVIGSDPPPRHSLPDAESIELRGFVEDVRDPLARYAVFVCPILSGSGVRVKLLEAFATGIPVVSTRLGAEGLASKDGEICALADDPDLFAERVVEVLENPEAASAMARRARAEVVEQRDMQGMTERLVECYREELRRMRGVA
jgi:GT2 family glycosyltransferase/glycosyltransferase involved in cell wall biosynthesis